FGSGVKIAGVGPPLTVRTRMLGSWLHVTARLLNCGGSVPLTPWSGCGGEAVVPEIVPGVGACPFAVRPAPAAGLGCDGPGLITGRSPSFIPAASASAADLCFCRTAMIATSCESPLGFVILRPCLGALRLTGSALEFEPDLLGLPPALCVCS